MSFSGRIHLRFKEKRRTASWTTGGTARTMVLSHSFGCQPAHSSRIQRRLQSMCGPSDGLRHCSLLQSLMRKCLSFQIVMILIGMKVTRVIMMIQGNHPNLMIHLMIVSFQIMMFQWTTQMRQYLVSPTLCAVFF